MLCVGAVKAGGVTCEDERRVKECRLQEEMILVCMSEETVDHILETE